MHALCSAAEALIGAMLARKLRCYLRSARAEYDLVPKAHLTRYTVYLLYVLIVNVIVTYDG